MTIYILKNFVEEILGEEIDFYQELFESYLIEGEDLTTLTLAIQDEFDLDITEEKIVEAGNIEELADLIDAMI